jgi:hypothetical protein
MKQAPLRIVAGPNHSRVLTGKSFFNHKEKK